MTDISKYYEEASPEFSTSPPQLTEKEKQAFLIKAAQSKLLNFCQLIDPTYEAEWFHEIIGEILEDAALAASQGRKKRIILTIPPRSGKTQTASIYFPTWALGKYPTLKFILSTYGADLSEKVGMKARDVMQSEVYKNIFPDSKLRSDTKSKANWMNTKGGSFFGVGVGGPITGTGANCVVPYCTIQSDNGNIPILKAKVGQKILSYDHKNKRITYTTVRAVAISRRDKRIFRVGNLKATGDHRIYTENKGYIPISELSDTDTIVTVKYNLSVVFKGFCKKIVGRKKENEGRAKERLLLVPMLLRKRQTFSFFRKNEMSGVWWKKSIARSLLPVLFQRKSEEPECESTMQPLSKRICPSVIGKKEKRHEGVCLKFLFYGLLSYFKSSKNRTECFCKKEVSCLPKRDKEKVLFSRLLSCLSLRKQKLRELFREIFSRKGLCLKKGRQVLSGLWCKNLSFTHSSHRQGFRKSEYKKSHNPLHEMPFIYSCAEGASAENIAELHGISDGGYLVDIQTDTENFFCEDILVHNCIIFDDPFKSREEAESKTISDKVWEYYRSTLYSRLEGSGVIIVIMQRWNMNDLVARLIDEDADRKERGEPTEDWEVINFPAIAEEDEYFISKGHLDSKGHIENNPDNTTVYKGHLVRHKGHPLWPSKFPLDVLDNIRSTLGLYNFSSQYQQNPIATESQEFKENMFQYFNDSDIEGKYFKYYTVVDPAISQRDNADNTVVLTVAKEVTGPNIYRIREDAGHFTPQQTINLIFKHQELYHSEVYIETIAYQKALKFSVDEEQKIRQRYFISKEFRSNVNKELRIRGLLPLYERGVIFHRQTDTEFELELLHFPRGKHDDRIDALSIALEVLSQHKFVGQGVRQYIPSSLKFNRHRR